MTRGRGGWAAVLVGAALVGTPARAEHGGWGWLVERLVADGLDRGIAERTFDDPRMGPFEGLLFSLHPREPRSLYRVFARPASILAARRCRQEHAAALAEAERAWGVPPSIVAAILHVESSCGRHTGSHRVLPRLARLAMANEPATLEDNLERLAAGDPAVEVEVRARARYLEQTFYPEVRATFTLAARLGVEPLELRGSEGGALGGPQFLPSHVLADAVDGDHDGRVDLDDGADAAASCACYLARHGWHPGLSVAERRRVLWQYNRSDAYVDAVLSLARRIDDRTPVRVATRRPAHAPPHRRRRHAPTKTAHARRPPVRRGS
jgi:membrane-bound lytic murein transglycosylase B